MKKESLSDETIARILNISVEEVRTLSN
jgi:DNA-binding CsgD family transcriptional regulator